MALDGLCFCSRGLTVRTFHSDFSRSILEVSCIGEIRKSVIRFRMFPCRSCVCTSTHIVSQILWKSSMSRLYVHESVTKGRKYRRECLPQSFFRPTEVCIPYDISSTSLAYLPSVAHARLQYWNVYGNTIEQ